MRSYAPGARGLQALHPVVGGFGDIAFGEEVLPNPSRQVGLVVDDENPRGAFRTAHSRFTGQVTVTVAPRPGPSLDATTSASESSASRRTTYSPRPVPGMVFSPPSPDR